METSMNRCPVLLAVICGVIWMQDFLKACWWFQRDNMQKLLADNTNNPIHVVVFERVCAASRFLQDCFVEDKTVIGI